MTKIKDIMDFFETVAPSHLQESYDNAGLIIGDPSTEIKGVLCCLDSTEDIIQEAKHKGCNLVIAHHPIVFSGLKKINGKNYIERTVIKAIKEDIAIYAIHTNLDNVLLNGVNQKIGEKLGLTNAKILSPKQQDQPEIGSGLIGVLPRKIKADKFLQDLKATMRTECIRYAGTLEKEISTVALCGGSGSFLLQEAIRQGADIFVTGDFKYHQFFDGEDKIIIADIGHYESEQFTIELLIELMKNNFRNFAAHYTNLSTNPIKYLV